MSVSRREDVKQYILAKGEALLVELQEIFPDVSSMTLRRDLARLEDEGHIRRTRGGAVAVSMLPGGVEGLYALRANANVAGKLAIADAAIKLVRSGHSLYLDSGSTIMYFAKHLPEMHYPIVTSGANIAVELARCPLFMVTLLGGQLNQNTLSVSGKLALRYVEDINIEIAVMACSGFDITSGFTSGSASENELKNAVIKKARQTILLMDSTKLNRSMPHTFATLQDIDILICDFEDDNLKNACTDANTQFICATSD